MEKKYKILIVEDDKNLMQILNDIFTQAGFEVEVASNAKEAIEKLKAGYGPDIIISDILMPEIDGFEFFKMVRSMDMPSCKNVPFVFLTALSDQENRIRGLGMGADDYITKPFDPQEVIIRIKNIIKRRESMRSTLAGLLKEVPLIDILQLLETQRKTGVLRISSAEKSGEVFFRNGRIVHVSSDGKTDKEACKEMLRWSNGEFVFISDEKPMTETMDENATELILNCMSELDEDMASKIESGFDEEKLESALKVLREEEEGIDIESYVEISDSTYWVGHREKDKTELQVNVYLRRFVGNGTELNLIVDPGPLITFNTVVEKCQKVVEDIKNIRMCAVTQPLPDACSSIRKLSELSEELTVLSSFENLRFIFELDMPRERFKPVDFLRSYTVNLPTGHKLVFIPMKFLPLRSSLGVYDPETKVLFSSYFLSGFVSPGDIQLFATEKDWEGIEKFAKFYFPTQKALAYAVENINKFTNGELEMIAPLYGKIIKGELIEEFIQKLLNLKLTFDS